MDLALTYQCRSNEEQVESELIDGNFLEETKEFVSNLTGDALEEFYKHVHSLLADGIYIGEAFDKEATKHKKSLEPLVIAKYAA